MTGYIVSTKMVATKVFNKVNKDSGQTWIDSYLGYIDTIWIPRTLEKIITSQP